MTISKFNEDTLSEKPAIEQLRRMKYDFIPGEKLDPQEMGGCERDSRREVVLIDRLRKKLIELNPGVSQNAIQKAVRRVTAIQGTGLLDENKNFSRDLLAGISEDEEQKEGPRRKKTIHFIDFDKPERNEFLAVTQFSVKGPKPPDRRPDIVIFINGIPLVVIECKSPTSPQGGIEKAVGDLIAYQELIPSLFRTNQILIGLNLFGARYGTVGMEPEHFLEWKAPPEENLGPKPSAQDVLISCLLSKQNLIDIIRNFIVFDTTSGRTIKKICRYQQFTAVQKIVKRVLTEKERKGIIWHWQGSGKSLTMLFAALKLKREEEKLKNPYIVIITDRKQLDRQIAKTFESCGFPNPTRAENARDLYKLLGKGVGQTIMTTVQKFNVTLDKPLSPSANIIVLTDEAHRSQYGTFALNLHKALPHAAVFAFTGTPLDKRNRNTYREFSPKGETYLDRYSPQQSEEDHATVPVKYASRLPNLHIVGASMDALLAELFPGKSADELLQIKKQYATAETLASAPVRLERIALDIAEHYRRFIKPNGFKAMIVAESREAVDVYKKALDRVMDPSLSRAVMTLNDKKDQKDHPDWAKAYALSEAEEEALKEAFCEKRDPLSFLIVCDKLLTGFDAPILQVVYMDKHLQEHTLLQAVTRCNRPYPHKNYGLVVDYAGFGRKLAEAIALFSREDLDSFLKLDDLEQELANLKDRHEKAGLFFKGLSRTGDSAKDILEQWVDVLDDADTRQAFTKAYGAFAKSMDFLMPDPRVEPYLKDFKWLGLVRQAARTRYRDNDMDLDVLGPKVRDLIHAHIAAEGVEEILEPLTITAPDFQEKLNQKPGDKSKAAHLEYALADMVKERTSDDPAFYESLQKQLEDLIHSQKKKRMEDAQLLIALKPIQEKALNHHQLAQSLGLDDRQFAFYNLLGEIGGKIPDGSTENRVGLVKELVDDLESRAVTGWTEREDIQKEMRRTIKRFLRAKGCQEDDLPPIVAELMELAQTRLKK